MGDRENAAEALAHMPRWVAVHENTLAKLDVIVALAGAEGYDVDDMLSELDEARSERDRATGVTPDEVTNPPGEEDRWASSSTSTTSRST